MVIDELVQYVRRIPGGTTIKAKNEYQSLIQSSSTTVGFSPLFSIIM